MHATCNFMIELFPPPGTLALAPIGHVSKHMHGFIDSSFLFVRILCLQTRQISSTVKNSRQKNRRDSSFVVDRKRSTKREKHLSFFLARCLFFFFLILCVFLFRGVVFGILLSIVAKNSVVEVGR